MCFESKQMKAKEAPIFYSKLVHFGKLSHFHENEEKLKHIEAVDQHHSFLKHSVSKPTGINFIFIPIHHAFGNSNSYTQAR